MACAGVVLTGGASRRMGTDKARITAPGSALSLAARTAGLLAGCCEPVVELGPGVSGVRAVPDPGRGPLAALAGAAGLWAALPDDGHVVLAATDLPLLTAGMLTWLAGHPAPGAVIPVDRSGRLQPLCARYPVAALRALPALVAGGEQRMLGWVATLAAHLAAPAEWEPAAGDPSALLDVDTPGDLAALQPGGAR